MKVSPISQSRIVEAKVSSRGKKVGLEGIIKDAASTSYLFEDMFNNEEFLEELMSYISDDIKDCDEDEALKIFKKIEYDPSKIAHSIVKSLVADKDFLRLLERTFEMALEDAANDVQQHYGFRSMYEMGAPDSPVSDRQTLAGISRIMNDLTDDPTTVHDIEAFEDPEYHDTFAVMNLDTEKTYLVNVRNQTCTEKKFKTWPPKVKRSV